ncbi:flagellar filament capping protein FliD [Carboxydocella sp. JDF658]|uniref:flagellar filament capping protein FliD n=1 Tax=Carboxydocella sp. JDF658 TaxID=1926600 RepID=UPI0009AC6E1C|nr:flagellar filament capping protein FliD [Carboxydocella sp. JDF658]GAW31871.1 flagellar cap protein [Carboxydocella sp. JDF658]
MSGNLRIGGLATGLDTDQIIKDLMKAERIPVDKLKQQKQIIEWKKEDYRSLNSALAALRNEVFNLKLEGTFRAKKATSADEKVVQAYASSAAVVGNYKVTVHSLAQGASKSSTAALGVAANPSQSLTAVNLTFRLNGKDITINAGDNINQVVSKINAAGAGVNASYDTTTDRLYLVTTAIGATAQIDFSGTVTGSDGANFLTNTLKLNVSLDAANNDTTKVIGKNAIIDFNDATNLTFGSNQVTIAGITLNLKSESATPVNISVNADVDSVVAKIKSFVDKYNETIELFNKKFSEERYKDYLPLTDEQRQQLSETMQQKWEEKARSGLLKGDSLISSALGGMRSVLSSIIQGLPSSFNQLSQIGITTGLYQENGKLYLNESKLREKLNTNPDDVMNIFRKDSTVIAEKGIAIRLYDEISNQINKFSAKAGSIYTYSLVDNSTLGKELKEINNRISAAEDRLKEKEDRYYRQFAALERAINMMNAQSSWLASQFGGGK